MTIDVYTGTPGAGKTLHATAVGLDAQHRPGGTIANYEVTRPIRDKATGRPKWLYVPEDEMTPDFLMEHARLYHKIGKESQGLLIIDEAHRVLNSRNWMDRNALGGRTRMVRFLSEHRHFGYDVILIAQGDLMLDKQVRFLIENQVKHATLDQLAWWLHFLRAIRLKVFVQIHWNYQFKQMGGYLSVGTPFPAGRGRYDFQAMRKRAWAAASAPLDAAPALAASASGRQDDASGTPEHSGEAGQVVQLNVSKLDQVEFSLTGFDLNGGSEHANAHDDFLVGEVVDSQLSRHVVSPNPADDVVPMLIRLTRKRT